MISWGWAPKSDLLRVDILNTIGVSMMLMGFICWMVNVWTRPGPAVDAGETRQGLGGYHLASLIVTASGTALLISLLTPLLWTTWRPDWLCWPLESYVNGVHNLGKPQAWLFPILPWSMKRLYVPQYIGVLTRVRGDLRQHSSGILSDHVINN